MVERAPVKHDPHMSVDFKNIKTSGISPTSHPPQHNQTSWPVGEVLGVNVWALNIIDRYIILYTLLFSTNVGMEQI